MDDFNLFDKDEDIKETKNDDIIILEDKMKKEATESHEEVKTSEDGVIEGSCIDLTEDFKQNSNAKQSDEPKTYYSETIKDNKPKSETSSFKRFIAGLLIASIVGGPMIGVGMQLTKSFTENIISQKATESTQKFTFDNNKNNSNITKINTNIEKTSISPATTIAKNVGPSVVGITSTISTRDFFNNSYNNDSNGSGIIFSEDNNKVYIVTNNHVIEGANTVVVTLSGDQKVEANFVGADSQTDLAVISVNKSDMSQESLSNLAIAKFGDSSELQVGELAIAIGNPLGLQFSNSVTQGIISGIDRQIQVDDRNFAMIQTDAAINPGNSGGALVNSKSEVIGINTVKYTDSTVEGMGFAIPTNIAKPIIEELMNNGYISRPYLGIRGGTVTEEISQIYALPMGVLVTSVIQNGPAANAGIQAGDVITEFDGEKITAMEQLTQLLKQHKSGDKISIGIVRNGKIPSTITVTLKDSGIQNEENNQQTQQYYYTIPFGR